jgi:hypothetical protein
VGFADAAADIAVLRDYADRRGVRLRLHSGPTGIDLEWLERRPGVPKGAGAAVLAALCAYADHIGQPLRLLVLAGRDRLLAYYGRFGFEVVHPAEGDLDSTEMERRQPITSPSRSVERRAAMSTLVGAGCTSFS